MTLSELPFNHLFSFVSVQDRFSCRIVCKDWFSRISFPEIGDLSEVIQKTGILTVKIFHLFSIPENHSTLSNVFTFLQTRKILNSANFYSAAVKNGFQTLIKALNQRALSQDHFDAVVKSSNLYELARGIPLLSKAQILNEDYLLLIAQSSDAWSLASCYVMLQMAGFLDDEVKNLVFKHPSAQMLNKVFVLLRENKCFTKENVKQVLKYPKIDKLIWMIPAQEYPWLATCQTDDWYAKQIYEVLKKTHILSLENKILTQEHGDRQGLYEAFMKLPTQRQTDLNFKRIASRCSKMLNHKG